MLHELRVHQIQLELILEANLTLATLLGLDRGTLVKQPVSRFVLEEDQNIYYLHRKQLFETGEPQECELRLVRPDGAQFWAQLKATAARAEDGAPLCRVIISDITERKEVEEALRDSEQRFQTLVNQAPAALFLHGMDGYIEEYNQLTLENMGILLMRFSTRRSVTPAGPLLHEPGTT